MDPDTLLDDPEAKSFNVSGLVSLAIFYLIVLAIGVWAGWRQRRIMKAAGRTELTQEDVMIAGRSMGYVVGILTMAGEALGRYTVHAMG